MTQVDPLVRLAHLRDTQDAFDSVAADYDGSRGNNELIQDMRAEMWSWLDKTFAPNSRLIDLGCGTGLDAVRMARRGHYITATDWSPHMVARTAARARQESVADHVQALPVGAHELQRLDGEGTFDGAYSNLGPLNCVPDLAAVSSGCARLLKPGGALVFTVIGRVCPWEIAHYSWRRAWSRVARLQASPATSSLVGMEQSTPSGRVTTLRASFIARSSAISRWNTIVDCVCLRRHPT